MQRKQQIMKYGIKQGQPYYDKKGNEIPIETMF
jgi:hypothetical protein